MGDPRGMNLEAISFPSVGGGDNRAAAGAIGEFKPPATAESIGIVQQEEVRLRLELHKNSSGPPPV